jgi:serine protease AprX
VVGNATAGPLASSGRGARENVLVVGTGAARAAARHGEIRARLPIVGGVSAVVSRDELGALAREPGVTRVVRDQRLVENALAVSRATTLATLYPTADDVQRSWDWGYTGAGVGIAIIDSGVSASPDFGNRLVQVRLSGQDGSLDDVSGHGTLVAGIAAGSSADGRYKGIAPGATVYAVNVARNGTSVFSSDVISGLNWVFENAHTYNIRVVNLSVSETTPTSYKQSLLDLAVERLWASGVLVVVAAGNTGMNPGSVDYAPANDPLVFTVGGMDDKGTAKLADDDIATFSARGTTMDGFVKPDLLAPGRRIASILPSGSALDAQAPAANRVAGGYATISGTSFAAPQVAGAAAVLFQENPGWSPDAVKYTLIDRARTVKSGYLKSLDVGATVNVWTPAGLSNQGVPALVCHPGATCLTDSGSIASIWDASSWTASSWTASWWTASSWTASSWTASSWTASSWTASSWTGTSDWSYMTWN